MSRHRAARWFVVVPLVVVTSSGLIAASRPASAAAAPGCMVAAQWVREHKAELPQTYAEIIRYPLDYRRYIQPELSWPARRELWRTQYHVYMSSGLLDTAQMAFMRHAEALLDRMFDPASPELRREQLNDSVSTAALPVLGRELTHRIFFVLGPDDDAGEVGSHAPSYFHLTANRGRVNVPAALVNCVCHVGVPHPECDTGTCNASSCTANGIMSGGCGTNGDFSCNGMCG